MDVQTVKTNLTVDQAAKLEVGSYEWEKYFEHRSNLLFLIETMPRHSPWCYDFIMYQSRDHDLAVTVGYRDLWDVHENLPFLLPLEPLPLRNLHHLAFLSLGPDAHLT